MLKIILPGRVPSKKNSRRPFIRNGRMLNFSSKAYEEWHKEQSLYLDTQAIAKIDPPYRLTTTFFAPTNRSQDNSNAFESVADLLVECGILEDDNWFLLQECVQKFGGVDRQNPRVEIVIEHLENGVEKPLKRGKK